MPVTITKSYLRRICRCTIFTAIFLMVMDSRLRPSFVPKEDANNEINLQTDHEKSQHLRIRREINDSDTNNSLLKNETILSRKIRQEEEEITEAPAEEKEEENEEAESNGPAPSEEGEEGEKPDKEEEEGEEQEPGQPEEQEEEEATTEPPKMRTSRITFKPSTRPTSAGKHTGQTKVPDKTEDEDEDEDADENETKTSWHNHSTTVAVPTTTQAEPVCTLPAIRQFPPDMFSMRQRRFGGLIIHILVVVYMFLCLAVVCDDYFCGSLEQVCKRLNLSEDVAGATLMAAGSSAPELFASLIGVFVAKGDVGTGTIVGSAVFNILFVVGTCAFFGGLDGAQLSWWPVVRDTVFYAISIVILIVSLLDGEVTWYESLVMLIFYGFYVATMRYNTRAYEFVAQKTGMTGPVQGVDETMRLAGGGRFDKPVFSGYEQFADEPEDYLPAGKPSAMTLPADERIKRNPRKLTFANAALKIMMSRYFYPRTRFIAACRFVIAENQTHAHERRRGRLTANFSDHKSGDSDYVSGNISGAMKYSRKSFDILHDEFEKWRVKPEPGAGRMAFARWLVLYPVYFVLYYTIPDSKKEKFAKWYAVTFGLSVLWIAIFSYIMVWMVTVIGYTMNIPDSIMGITFLAAGTSIPDAMASLIVARQGMVDMAVSNSIGSNVFDILIGLAFPWFLATALTRPGQTVKINSNGLVYNAVLLFVTVGIAVGGLRSTGWKLTRRIGTVFYVTYGIYLILAIMIEYNVFGFVNPRMCSEDESTLRENIMELKAAG